MQITLLTGEVVNLKWNWLVVERLENTVGNVGQLTKKNIEKRGQAKTAGDMVYAVVQSNIQNEYKRDELLSLIDMDDFGKIMEYISENEKKSEKVVGKKK